MYDLPSEKLKPIKNTGKKLSKAGKIILSDKGKPEALLLYFDDDEITLTWKQFKIIKLLNKIRLYVERQGYLFRREINAEIKAARRQAKISAK